MASLKKNVEQVLTARGLSRAELSSRVGLSESELVSFLRAPPKRSEGLLQKLSRELIVPDFFLFAETVPIPEARFPDFRLSKPARTGYARETLQWMDFATSIQLQADESAPNTKPTLSLKTAVGTTNNVSAAAKNLRERLGFTFELQTEAKDARTLFAWLRRQIETLNVFVLLLSFPEKDGVGFCLTGKHYDVIVLNTRKQSPPRRLFTLAHEIFHCALGMSGVSDPFVINNAVERACNQFAVEFLAPTALVKQQSAKFIHSSTLEIDQLSRFAKAMKLSMHASVIRLVELEIYRPSAIGAWQRFIRSNGDPEISAGGGGRRQEEWKYKLAKYGFKFAEVFGEAKTRGVYDDYEFYQLSGIKPKYQDDYIQRSSRARPEDAIEVEGGEDA
ncbi:ImmA/IrrE family metallo-endopeptidase [Bradyrhizobium embrapense]|uniref:ImmA/IrrE family metallo-endopeptidase n=1 Tax=Bradyrhizobium embrapense TaxID=630921 RepID=UPI00067D08B9|nr:ImmA/IrrE family metallo-endopeptidase [Bradyrhizobium embrapense]